MMHFVYDFPNGEGKPYIKVTPESVTAEEAAALVRELVKAHKETPGDPQVMITDMDDFCNFLWSKEKGVIFPKFDESDSTNKKGESN